MKTIIFFSLLLLLIVGTSGSLDTLLGGLPIVGGLVGPAPLGGGSTWRHVKQFKQFKIQFYLQIYLQTQLDLELRVQLGPCRDSGDRNPRSNGEESYYSMGSEAWQRPMSFKLAKDGLKDIGGETPTENIEKKGVVGSCVRGTLGCDYEDGESANE
ncbi:hypothetical protein QR680_015728 [Steinernema hermaphroditum]|uniref:Uncharacterized protein n=1 Tax=Steinernema hermaphroditum TaxID=289476 RepID=A0AA39LL90_9BILA|nr:hypothetical protein QR680_015728 [Steinernema hermaphroditum]